jgi:hypothetical protein
VAGATQGRQRAETGIAILSGVAVILQEDKARDGDLNARSAFIVTVTACRGNVSSELATRPTLPVG